MVCVHRCTARFSRKGCPFVFCMKMKSGNFMHMRSNMASWMLVKNYENMKQHYHCQVKIKMDSVNAWLMSSLGYLQKHISKLPEKLSGRPGLKSVTMSGIYPIRCGQWWFTWLLEAVACFGHLQSIGLPSIKWQTQGQLLIEIFIARC